jgi:hypothetical protein
MGFGDPGNEWPNAGRVVWLQGGLVAYNNPGPDVEICAGSNGRTIRKFTIGKYGALYEVLKSQGFSIIGATFVEHPEELEGLRPPQFRVAGRQHGWPLWDAREKWRQIAFAASQLNDMALTDLSSRIASGLEYGQSRLYDLAAAYGTQLRACVHKDPKLEYQAFKDLNSREVYKCIHALFWELAVLRDTLGEFAALQCFSLTGIRTVGSLAKRLKTGTFADPLAKDILNITSESLGGWLSRFTSYRNFFTHIAPMEQAMGTAFTILDTQRLNDTLSVPQIYYPLPRDIEKLTRERSKGNFYPNLETLIAASRSRRDRTCDPDALEYLHSCLGEFVDLATTLVSRSPITPVPIQITREDIIGDIKWKPGATG